MCIVSLLLHWFKPRTSSNCIKYHLNFLFSQQVSLLFEEHRSRKKKKQGFALSIYQKKSSSLFLTHSYLHRNDIKTTGLTSLAAQLTPAEAVITRIYQSIFISEHLLEEPALGVLQNYCFFMDKQEQCLDKLDFYRIRGEEFRVG